MQIYQSWAHVHHVDRLQLADANLIYCVSRDSVCDSHPQPPPGGHVKNCRPRGAHETCHTGGERSEGREGKWKRREKREDNDKNTTPSAKFRSSQEVWLGMGHALARLSRWFASHLMPSFASILAFGFSWQQLSPVFKPWLTHPHVANWWPGSASLT